MDSRSSEDLIDQLGEKQASGADEEPTNDDGRGNVLTETNADRQNEHAGHKLMEARRRLFHSHASLEDGCSSTKVDFQGRLAEHLVFSTDQGSSHDANHISATGDAASGRDRADADNFHYFAQIPALLWSLETAQEGVARPRRSGRIGASQQGPRLNSQQSNNNLSGTQQQGDNKNGSIALDNSSSLTLRFSECSVVCVARWVSQQLLQTRPRGTEQGDGRRRSQYCASLAEFRICGVCGGVGHFESKCPQQTPEQSRIMEATAAAAKNGQAKSEGNEAHLKQHRRKDGSDVLVELCNGFWVEQRSVPHKITVQGSRSNGTSTVDETEVDGFLIRATNDSSSGDLLQTRAGDIVAWQQLVTYTSDGKNNNERVLYVGVVASDGNEEADNVRIRCVSVVSPRPRKDGKEETRVGGVGKEFLVARESLFSVDEAMESSPPPAKEDSQEKQVSPDAFSSSTRPTSVAATRSREQATKRERPIKFGRLQKKPCHRLFG